MSLARLLRILKIYQLNSKENNNENLKKKHPFFQTQTTSNSKENKMVFKIIPQISKKMVKIRFFQ